jgi:hypothetical protein
MAGGLCLTLTGCGGSSSSGAQPAGAGPGSPGTTAPAATAPLAAMLIVQPVGTPLGGGMIDNVINSTGGPAQGTSAVPVSVVSFP